MMAGITVDFSTDAGKVRLIIPDTNVDSYVYDDEEIDAFLSVESSNVRRAAALALETIASNEAYTLKHISALDLNTNGPAVAESLYKRAEKLREQSYEDEARNGDLFDFGEWATTPATRREKIINTVLENRG